MADEITYYARVAEAEKAVTDAGYSRASPPKAVWVSPDGRKTAKVQREAPGKFYVEWS